MSSALPSLRLSTGLPSTPRAPHQIRSFINKEFSSCKLTNFSFAVSDSDAALQTSQPTPKSVSPGKDSAPFRRRQRAVPEPESKSFQDSFAQTVQPTAQELKRKESTAFDSYTLYRDEIRKFEETLDERELSLRTSLLNPSGSIEDAVKEYQIYTDYLSELTVRIKRKDPRLAMLLTRGVDGCRKTFAQVTEGQVMAELPASPKNSKRHSASPVKGRERCSQTSALDMLKEERHLASPELYQTKEALGRLKKLKYSDMYSTLVDLYTNLTNIRTDIPEASETPDTWEPEEYHQELRMNLKEMHRVIAEKASTHALRKAVREVFVQTEVEQYDPKMRILEGQLREKNIEINRLHNEVNLLKMEKKQEAELLARTRERVRELEEKVTRLELEVRSSKRKEANVSTNLQELKHSQQLSDNHLAELIKGQYRLKALLYKSDARARNAEKGALGNERLAEELKIHKEATEKRLQRARGTADATSTQSTDKEAQIDEEMNGKLKALEKQFSQKERELEVKQTQEFDELNQEIARLEALLAEFQNIKGISRGGSVAYSDASDPRFSPGKMGEQGHGKDQAYMKKAGNPATITEAEKADDSDAEGKSKRKKGKKGKKRREGGSQSRESSSPESRMNSRRGGDYFAGDEDQTTEGGRRADDRGRDPEMRRTGEDYGEITGRGRKGSISGQPGGTSNAQRRKQSFDAKEAGKYGNPSSRQPAVDLSHLDSSDLDLLQVIFGTSDLSSLPPDELQLVLSDLSAFKQLPPSEREVFYRVRESIRKQMHRPMKVSLERVEKGDEDLLRAMFGVKDLAVVEKEYLAEAVQDLGYFRTLPEAQKTVYVRIRDTMRRHMQRLRRQSLGITGVEEVTEDEEKTAEQMQQTSGNLRKGGDGIGLNSIPSTELERNPELIFDNAPGHNFYIPGLSKDEQLKYEMHLRRIMQGHDHQRCGSECEHLRRAYLYRKKMHGKVFPMKVVHLTYRI